MIAWNDASALRQAALGRELRLSAFAEYEQQGPPRFLGQA